MSQRKIKLTMPELKKALIRAVTSHGHNYTCSASRGMERDCHCGWLEIREMVKSIVGGKPCTYCFGDKTVSMSDGSKRRCEYCGGTGIEPAQGKESKP